MGPAACPAGDIGSPVTGGRPASPKSGRIQFKISPGLELSPDGRTRPSAGSKAVSPRMQHPGPKLRGKQVSRLLPLLLTFAPGGVSADAAAL